MFFFSMNCSTFVSLWLWVRMSGVYPSSYNFSCCQSYNLWNSPVCKNKTRTNWLKDRADTYLWSDSSCLHTASPFTPPALPLFRYSTQPLVPHNTKHHGPSKHSLLMLSNHAAIYFTRACPLNTSLQLLLHCESWKAIRYPPFIPWRIWELQKCPF